MATEQYANLAATTLNGAINNSTVSITVTSASGFPTSNQYRVIIDTELMIVTAGAGTTSWTVTRGAEGTTAASHSNLAAVTQVLTRDGLKALGTVLHPDGTFASRAAAAAVNEGVVSFPSDGVSLQRSNGSLWVPSGPIFPMVEPIDASYAWLNQGGASVDTTHGGIILSVPNFNGEQIRGRVKSVPAAPYTVTVAFLPMMPWDDILSMGLLLRDSVGGKIATFALRSSTIASVQTIYASKYNSVTSVNSDYITTPASVQALPWQAGPCMWFQIVDDNTNRLLKVSNDGINFFQIATTPRTNFVTPDQIGFFINANTAVSYTLKLNILSWKEE